MAPSATPSPSWATSPFSAWLWVDIEQGSWCLFFGPSQFPCGVDVGEEGLAGWVTDSHLPNSPSHLGLEWADTGLSSPTWMWLGLRVRICGPGRAGPCGSNPSTRMDGTEQTGWAGWHIEFPSQLSYFIHPHNVCVAVVPYRTQHRCQYSQLCLQDPRIVVFRVSFCLVPFWGPKAETH